MCLDHYPAIRTRIGRTMMKNPGLKGETIKYFGVAGVKYLFYIQGNQLKDMYGTVIANGITGTKFNHVYYADGNQEYMILYGEGVTPTRHKLPCLLYTSAVRVGAGQAPLPSVSSSRCCRYLPRVPPRKAVLCSWAVFCFFLLPGCNLPEKGTKDSRQVGSLKML